MADHEHVWREGEVACEDCGTHPALYCTEDDCEEVLDLVRKDDPRVTGTG
jgi:hypothetical protein